MQRFHSSAVTRDFYVMPRKWWEDARFWSNYAGFDNAEIASSQLADPIMTRSVLTNFNPMEILESDNGFFFLKNKLCPCSWGLLAAVEAWIYRLLLKESAHSVAPGRLSFSRSLHFHFHVALWCKVTASHKILCVCVCACVLFNDKGENKIYVMWLSVISKKQREVFAARRYSPHCSFQVVT